MSEQGAPDSVCSFVPCAEAWLLAAHLAELCDLSPNTISLIERGDSSPSVSTLHRWPSRWAFTSPPFSKGMPSPSRQS